MVDLEETTMTDDEKFQLALTDVYVGDTVSLGRILCRMYRAAEARADTLAEECRQLRKSLGYFRELWHQTGEQLAETAEGLQRNAKWMQSISKDMTT